MLNETIHNMHPHVVCQISVRAKSEDSQLDGPYSKVPCQTKSAGRPHGGIIDDVTRFGRHPVLSFSVL